MHASQSYREVRPGPKAGREEVSPIPFQSAEPSGRFTTPNGSLPWCGRTAPVDPELSFLTVPRGEQLRRKADDQVPRDRAVTMCA
jgi:hypothetical protein